MSEKNLKKHPAKIEDALRDGALTDALEFIAYLRENNMNPGKTSKNGWKISRLPASPTNFG